MSEEKRLTGDPSADLQGGKDDEAQPAGSRYPEIKGLRKWKR